MGRKNSPSANKELNELIAQYETARAENRQLYLDGDQLADIADQYAAGRKFNEAQEVITYGLHLHPDSTDLLVEQAYLYLDTGKIPLAKKVVERYRCENAESGTYAERRTTGKRPKCTGYYRRC